MSVDLTPWAINGNTHSAGDARAALCSKLGGTPGAWTTSTTATDGAHGIAFSTDFKVTQNGTPNMSVNVAAGSAFVRCGQADSQAYHVRSTATVNLSIGAADAVNARRDLVILQVRDAEFSGADRDARLFVVAGTPSGSPSDPSLASFPNALVLARIQVNASPDATIVTGDITDLRVGARGAAWFQPRGIVGYAETTSDQGGFAGTELDTALAVSVTRLANRQYKASAFILVSPSDGNPGTFALRIKRATTELAEARAVFVAGETHSKSIVGRREIPSAGDAPTYSVTAQRLAGSNTLTVAGVSSPCVLWVEDVGAAVA